ncbi:Hsp20/alpha crystallin family protein [Caldovatus aquaticus]|uniref:Hsp20/alpha crystallin family protein n=1 Tax=Caldovatus aquaticus TaxID=2865671 RepID=A0ABS7F3L0_9PROT|nr:Hsp20/alpha crystallin family protein [Caldovatus aquaticus]MBW8270192.1 Hsp20/alpha crystallin family protein [Caldovatus aquaticus]
MTAMSMRDIAPWAGGRSRVPSLFRDDPGSLFASLRQEVDRLFDEAFRDFGSPFLGFRSGAGWPTAEVVETDKEIRATFELPGVDEKDVEVLLEDGDLIVRGEKRSETADRDRRFTERFYGRFERRIPLGREIQEDQVRAEFRNGVLTVTAPKSPQAEQRMRRIPVAVAA